MEDKTVTISCAKGSLTFSANFQPITAMNPCLCIHIEVPRVIYEKLSGDRMGETSESICKRVQAARNIQLVSTCPPSHAKRETGTYPNEELLA